MPLELTIVLGLRNQATLKQLLADQQDPASPRYHQWLTPQEFASRFGPTDKQAGLVADWLKGEGFDITSVNPVARTIKARGDAETAERAFSTTLISDGVSFANTTDPSIPAQFDGLVVSIMGLDNMHAAAPAGLHRIAPPPRASTRRKLETLALADVGGSSSESALPTPAAEEASSTAFGPTDVETFYDELPLLNAGNTGSPSPDCIALDEDSNYLPSAVTLYDSTFGLAPAAITNVYPDGGTPGRTDDEVETLLDIEYAHASAPGTPIHPYIGSVLYDAIQQSVTDGACGAISISFIFCGESPSFYTGLDMLFQEAATQGQSVFIASGDWGAAGLQYSATTRSCVTGTVRNASEMAASPHVTAVGGTTFTPSYSAGDDISVIGVAPGGIETGWNGSGGGQSAIFPKPDWQTGAGVPDDNARDIPDVAMIAWAPYVFIGADDDGSAEIQCCWGGTSLSTPLWAGYSRVLAEASGNARLGLLDPAIYSLANAGPAADGVEDVVSGNNSFNGVTGFTAGPGYSQVTGWGSVDMTEFANAFAAQFEATPTPTATATPTPTATATATPTAATTPSALEYSSAKVKFGEIATGASSIVKTVKLSNPDKKKALPIALESWNATGDFSVSQETTTCAVTTLSPGQNCKIGLIFKPTHSGARPGTLTILDNAGNNPQVIQLMGTGK